MEIISKEWRKRLAQCRFCDYSVKNKIGISCGSLLIGDVIYHENKGVHLCGCLMKLKTKLPNAQCPINKWKE